MNCMLALTRVCYLFLSVLDSPFNITTVVVIAMAVFCAACLATIIYMKMKLAAKPKPDPDRETYV